MKVALDPYMLRRTPLAELPALVAGLGYEHLELSPREDFLPFFTHPRADRHAPHTFHQGGNLAEIMRYAGPLLTHVHVADSYDFRASSGLRHIVNPPGSAARVHQHLYIGQGEVDWPAFFGTLDGLGFDGIMTACVFAWEDRAHHSSRFMRAEINRYIQAWRRRP